MYERKIMNARWTIIGSTAVVVLGMCIVLRAAPTSPGQVSDTQATATSGQVVVGSKPLIKAGPGIPQELRVMPPIAVDYRRDATNIRRRGAYVIVGDREIGRFRTREGGVASSAIPCIGTEECADCNACTKDECNSLICENPFVANGVPEPGCDDGLFCNGLETCDGAGTCSLGMPPSCPELCEEGDGTHICVNSCSTDPDCDDLKDCTTDSCNSGTGVCTYTNACGPDATCTEAGFVCGTGRCCVGAACDQVTKADCDTDGGVWLSTPTACELLETGNSDICPSYGGGIAPQGAFEFLIGPISPLAATGNPLCLDDYTSLGDDYATNLGTDYMDVMLLRFAGDVEPESPARWTISFWDSNFDPPIFIEDVFWPDGTNDDHDTETTIKTVDFDPPLTIPTSGIIVWSVQENFGPNGRVNLLTTDAVDVGSNDPARMWVNGAMIEAGDDGPVLNTDRRIAFELVATPVVDPPLAACCAGATNECFLKLPWECEADGGIPQDVGVQCASCSNDLFQSCVTNADCKACVGGNLAGGPCANLADCDDGQGNPGTCTGQATCNPILPACLISACCAGSGECANVAGGSWGGPQHNTHPQHDHSRASDDRPSGIHNLSLIHGNSPP